jgi:hypothetical protein
MRPLLTWIWLVPAAWTLGVTTTGAHEFSGYVSIEGRPFFQDPMFPGQEEHNGSIAAQPEYYHQWENGASLTFVPFGRLDSADSERTHADVRELNVVWPYEDWYLRVGVGKVFWGASEFVHLVDVVNQTDLVEHVDGEDKLGQPMVQFSIAKDWGILDFYILPFFRERTFPGREGRLRPGTPINTDRTLYESSSEQNTVDLAIRYSRTLGDADVGVYLFKGTNREPYLIASDLVPPEFLDPNSIDEPALIPFYDQITQLGADVQWATGNWLWKLETLYRSAFFDTHFAGVGGFEYTFYGLADTKTDFGLLAEYAYDERGKDETTTSLYDNDLILGTRLTPNDAAGTQLLGGFVQDLEDSTNILILETSRRFGSHWRLSLDAWFFLDVPEDSLISGLRDDDFLRLELSYYF